jgi:hypothetical protein
MFRLPLLPSSEKPVKRVIRFFALASLSASMLYGDWKIVTRTGDSSVTEFFKGELVRTDSSPAYTAVMDFNHRQQFIWRSDLRQYAIVQWPPAYKSDLPPASVITIERNTTDTGQRKPRTHGTSPGYPCDTQ